MVLSSPQFSFSYHELAADFHIYPAERDYEIHEVSLLSSPANHEVPRCRPFLFFS
jgi:hypothetical protein